jgi:anti-sigma factor RsiW
MNEMVCVSGVEQLMDYLEGVVPPDLRVTMEHHVAGCPRCTAFIASYCETPRILREATATPFNASVESSLKAFLRARTTAFHKPS